MWYKFTRHLESPFLSEVYEFAAFLLLSSTMLLSFVNPFTAVISLSKYLFDRQTCSHVPQPASINIANMAGVQAVSMTTDRNTSEGNTFNRHLCMTPTDPFFLLVRDTSFIYTQFTTVVLKDGTIVTVKSSAEVANVISYTASLEQRANADALSAASASLVLNRALAHPSVHIFSLLGIFY